MYIRRKVFSLLQDETGEERYFSTTDVTLENEEERTFSVAEDAESLEEKDFSDKKKRKMMSQNLQLVIRLILS